MKSTKNKTIDFTLSQSKEYLSRCLKTEDLTSIPENCTVIGDFYATIGKVKDESVDLLIIDPPYNLDKNFHGNTFKKSSKEDYREYVKGFIDLVKPKLKRTATVYVCCDWKSALTIGMIVDENFILRNRITWQREKGRGAKANWKNGMEDVFFATVSNDYTFNLDAVMVRKKVLAPYRENGKPKDWEETDIG
ncbi:MAG: site-specific DNA-methyltransferase, partial [Clostridiales bacterium]|nr:site-specific DNA-methyltransferase [Clostridiales bacterium]